MKNEIFSIEYMYGDKSKLKIENHTNNNLVLSIKPIKPKRKYTDFLIVKCNSFIILDNMEIDLKQVIFYFK